MKETPIVHDIQLALSHGDTRLWRNNVGEAWQGKVSRHTYLPGAIVIQSPRRVNFGLCAGSADLVGYHTIVVTPDMVGQRIAIFTGVEVKGATGHMRKLQLAWNGLVSDAGGYAGIARSVDDARTILRLK